MKKQILLVGLIVACFSFSVTLKAFIIKNFTASKIRLKVYGDKKVPEYSLLYGHREMPFQVVMIEPKDFPTIKVYEGASKLELEILSKDVQWHMHTIPLLGYTTKQLNSEDFYIWIFSESRVDIKDLTIKPKSQLEIKRGACAQVCGVKRPRERSRPVTKAAKRLRLLYAAENPGERIYSEDATTMLWSNMTREEAKWKKD